MTRLPEEEANSRPALSLDTCQPTREGSARLPAALGDRRAPKSFIVRDANGQALAYVISKRSLDAARRRTSSPVTRQGASPPTRQAAGATGADVMWTSFH